MVTPPDYWQADTARRVNKTVNLEQTMKMVIVMSFFPGCSTAKFTFTRKNIKNVVMADSSYQWP